MKKLLICPAERPGVSFLAQPMPLVTAPLLGQSLLEYWLSALAAAGTQNVVVLANDRPEQVEALVGNGERWGLAAKTLHESRELTPAQALLKYANELEAAPGPEAIVVLDHFPGEPDYPLFTDYSAWMSALQHWMPRALTPDRVGLHQVKPGVWLGSHSHVSPEAELVAPCWLGDHVFVGPGAVVGPESIVENGAFLEAESQVIASCVAPDTFVGRYARIVNAIAWADTLIDWSTGRVTHVAEPFIMCALRQPRRERTVGFFHRLAEIYGRSKEEVALASKPWLLHKEG